jgi:LuxR family transcriptional regulator, maltose regulon positive regulatory protein
LSVQYGYVLAERAGTFLNALVCVAEGGHEEARRLLASHRQVAARAGNRWHELLCEIYDAYALLQRGDRNAAAESMNEWLPQLRTRRYLPSHAGSNMLLSALFAFALSERAGEDWLPALIKQRRLRCPAPELRSWPWPVRISSLGAFTVDVGASGAGASAKPQHKLLELLKALVALSRDGVSGRDLADGLWPDAEGDTAQNSLQVSLYRLRRMLGHDDAIQLRDGKLTLNRAVCWVDAWAFEDLAERLKTMKAGDSPFEHAALAALELYRAHLLAKEKEQVWMLAPREKLKRSWSRVVKALGLHYESGNRWSAAADLYHAALDSDPVAEEFYWRLMVCLERSGNAAEALGTYHRCKEQLFSKLGAKPSAEMEQLYRELIGSTPAARHGRA